METRKVIIINSKTQSQKVIQNSSAVTLGELKKEMRERDIEYEGMDFMEGHARVTLKDDNSILPSNIPYKGQIVNDLTFLLTAPEKKIKSGSMTRNEVYNAIKAAGLQEECVKKFGKNFTMCRTQDLIDLVESKSVKAPVKEEEAPVKETKKEVKEVKETKKNEKKTKKKVAKENSCTCEGNVTAALKILLEDLYDIIGEDVYNKAMEALEGKEVEESDKIPKAELEEMFGDMLRG